MRFGSNLKLSVICVECAQNTAARNVEPSAVERLLDLLGFPGRL